MLQVLEILRAIIAFVFYYGHSFKLSQYSSIMKSEKILIKIICFIILN